MIKVVDISTGNIVEREPTEADLAAEASIFEQTMASITPSVVERRIDAAIGRVRLRWITDVPGQEAVYQAKAVEARAVQAAIAVGGTPDPATCPHLVRDAARHGTTLAEEVEVVAGMEALWLGGISPVLEGLRLGGKERARAATTAAAAMAVANAVEAAVPALLAVPDGPDLIAGLEAVVAAIEWPG